MTKLILLLPFLTFLSLYSTPTAAQTCVSGMAGIYPCSNVDLLATMTFAELSDPPNIPVATSANDIWGWTSPTTGKEYALVGLRNGTAFVDVSTPTAPIFVGHLATASGNSSWRDIKVVGNYAYIGSEASGHQLQTFNLSKLDNASNLPVAFTQDGNPTIYSTGNSHNVIADPIVGYVGTVGSRNNAAAGGGMVFFDVASNAALPSISGTFSPPVGGSDERYSHDAVCVTYHGPDTDYIGQQICFGFNEDIVVAADVTDKSNTIYIGNTSYGLVGYTHQGWISDDHKYIYLNDETDEIGTGNNTRTYIIDITDLDNMFPIAANGGYFESGLPATDHNLYIKGNYMYQSNYRAGLRIIDIQNKEAPIEVGYFDVFPADNNNGTQGAWSVYPYFKSGIMVINHIGEGLFIVQPNISHYVMENLGTGVQSVCKGSNANFFINLDSYAGFGSNVNLTATGHPAGSLISVPGSVSANGNATLTVTTTSAAAAGSYQLTLTGNSGQTSEEVLSMGVIIKPDPSASILQTPNDLETDVSPNPLFTWNAANDTDTYNLQVATDPAFNTIVASQTGITSTSTSISGLNNSQTYYWRITSVNDCSTETSAIFSFVTSAALPVELINFTATPQRNTILLNWTTATEHNNQGFSILRRTKDRPTDFETIAWVEGIGESTTEQAYHFEDKTAKKGVLYFYQLRQTDVDGSTNLSEVISAKMESFEEMVSVFPNPVQDLLSVKFTAFDLPINEVQLRVINVAGQVLRKEILTIPAGEINYQLPTENLSSGIYFMEFSLEGEIFRKRFAKN